MLRGRRAYKYFPREVFLGETERPPRRNTSPEAHPALQWEGGDFALFQRDNGSGRGTSCPSISRRSRGGRGGGQENTSFPRKDKEVQGTKHHLGGEGRTRGKKERTTVLTRKRKKKIILLLAWKVGLTYPPRQNWGKGEERGGRIQAHYRKGGKSRRKRAIHVKRSETEKVGDSRVTNGFQIGGGVESGF